MNNSDTTSETFLYTVDWKKVQRKSCESKFIWGLTEEMVLKQL